MTALTEEVQDSVQRAPRRVGRGVRDAALVLLGAADFCRERLGDLVATMAGTPRTLRDAALRTPARVRDAVEELHERGEELVHVLERRPAVREAEERTQHAIRGARSVTGSARRAAVAGAEAARAGAEAARDVAAVAVGGEGAAAYEDWTYAELYQLAAARDIEGRSTMAKDELIAALRRR